MINKKTSVEIHQNRSVTTFFNRLTDNFDRKFDGFPAIPADPSVTPAAQSGTDGFLDFNPQDIIDEIANSYQDSATPPCPDEVIGDDDPCYSEPTVEPDFDGDPTRAFKSIGSSIPTVYPDSTSRWFSSTFQYFSSSAQPGTDSWTSGVQAERGFVGLGLGGIAEGQPAGIKLQARVVPASGASMSLPWEIVLQDWDPFGDPPDLDHGTTVIATGTGEQDVDLQWSVIDKLYTEYAQFVLRFVTHPAGTAGVSLLAHSSFAAEGVGWKAWTYGPHDVIIPCEERDSDTPIMATLIEDSGSYSTPTSSRYIVDVWYDDLLAVKDIDYTDNNDGSITPTSSIDAGTVIRARYIQL